MAGGVGVRYVTRTYRPGYVETPLWDDQRESFRPCLNVDDANRVDTGLVTSTGEAIYRVQPPVGFGRDDEW